ncbi:autotransporter outer membrane beta-barrel domain-containing protein [Pantoea sp. Cy-640]|uniref:autotransporter outer membrane beta-barrel domain-containing protein n=1 Tax=Pantoea sp. Cy-640 TaxID=2608353 RepID=UPI00141912D2|nr:autotransporter outer membrane beta-barrel domain-containing protein [Pantoea sp. Cy-640]NIG13655.1 autotransporter outer membrane beta-barrel domain-containing protein [Pantoea sp. Cy-640]
MNKSYRVIWNYALQCYVVTSELARGKVKSSCSGKAAGTSRLVSGALGSALLLAGSPMALAANGATVNNPAQPVELNNQTLQATGDKYYGLLVQNGAKATATDVTVLNAGTSGYGVFSTAGSASAEMTRGSVTTSGAGGYGVVASLTGAVKTDGTKVETSGQTAHAAYANSAGIINSTDTDYITHGDGAYGAYSRAAGSLIDLSGGNVTTDGSKAYGLVAGLGSKLNASGVHVVTNGESAFGLYAGSASTLNGSNTQVTTRGDKAYGVVTESAGTQLTFTDGKVTTTGQGAHGFYARTNSILNVSDVQASTSGQDAHGLYAADAGTLIASGVQVTTSGKNAYGGYATGEGSVLNVDNSAFVVSGADANGLTASSKSTLNASDTAIKVTGSGIGVLASGTGTMLNISDSQIDVGGDALNAVYARYSSTANIKNIDIISDAKSEAALASAFSATMNAENVSVQARSGGYGIEVQDGGIFNGNNITIDKTGSDAEGFNSAIHLVNLYDPDLTTSLSLTNSDIRVTGENATGILSRYQATLADIKLANTAISATGGTAVNVLTGTNMHIDADNSVLSGSTLLKTGYSTTEGATAGSVVMNGSNHSLFEGNVDIDRSQTTDSQINLSGSSAWTGASSGLQTLTLSDNSQWNITGDSSVDALSASNSTLNFTHDGTGFSTLTVNGNYSGDNSTLVMNAALGDDNSATDKLHILGDSSGSTDVVVNNAGGSGAQTIQGLNIIQVDGASNGEFRQKGRIVAGAYDYNLVKGADQHGWYLVSDKNGSEPDPVVTPGEGGQIVEPPVNQHNMIVRPEAASYSANLAAANTLFTTSMDDRPAETFYTDANGQQQSTRLWLHNSAGHSRVKDSSGQLKSDTNRYAIQLGGDVASGTLTGSDSLRFGAMAGYGNAQSKSRSAVSGYQSRGQVNGYSLGVYGSWQQNAAEQSGAFIDSTLSYGWFNNSVKGDDIGQKSYKSKGISASLAGGYRAEVATLSDSTSLWLRPQAQLNWQGVKADDVKEQNGSRVQGTGQDNLQSRLGVRASLRTLLDPQSQSAIEPYAEANWLHNSRAFGTALNGVNIQQAGTRNAAEVKLGVDARLNANVNLWGGVAQQLGNHSYSDTSAVAGVKVSF